MEFDLFTLLPLAAAVFVFWKLRSVLGTRNGTERPPYDPYVDGNRDVETTDSDDNVVTLPGARGRRGEEAGASLNETRIEKIAGDDDDLKKGLKGILARDPEFDPAQFLSGAKIAYEMIVTGFADGDKRALKGLLSREVYDNFASVIDDRTKNGEKIQATFVGIENAKIVGAELVRDEAQITLSFVSQMISATLNDAEEVIEGDREEVAEIKDVWTFARPVKSRDPNWKLVATDA